MAENDNVRVLVTGFGPFQNFTTNPSFELVKRLPPTLPGAGGIQVLAHPDPLPAAYHALLAAAPRLLDEHADPDFVVHVGLAADQAHFAVEQGARRDGYHQVPDAARRVLGKGEGAALWGRQSAERLETSFDLGVVLEGWKRRVAGSGGGGGGGGGGKKRCGVSKKGGGAGAGNGGGGSGGTGGAAPDLRHTDDVGSYVCGLLYYATLAELAKRDADGSRGRHAVFLHVPLLTTEEELQKGARVLAALIESLAEAWRNR